VRVQTTLIYIVSEIKDIPREMENQPVLDKKVTDQTDEKNSNQQSQDTSKKLKEKLQTLRSRRTGVERRQQREIQKKSEQTAGKKPKSAMRSMARETIHDLLGKFGVQDAKLEDDVMREISSGKIRSAQDVASYLVRRLETLFPKGPAGRTTNVESKSEVSNQSSADPAAPITIVNTNNTPQQESTHSSEVMASKRKQLHRPTSDLIK